MRYKVLAGVMILALSVLCVMWFAMLSPALGRIRSNDYGELNQSISTLAGQYDSLFTSVEKTSYTLMGFSELYLTLQYSYSEPESYPSSSEFYKDVTVINAMVSHYLENDNIYSFSLYNLDDENLLLTGKGISGQTGWKEYEQAKKAKGRPVWGKMRYIPDLEESGKSMGIISMCRLVVNPNTYKPVGVMCFSVSQDTLYGTMRSYDERHDISTYLCGADGTIYVSGNEMLTGTNLNALNPDIDLSAPDRAYRDSAAKTSRFRAYQVGGYDLFAAAIVNSNAVYYSTTLMETVMILVIGLAVFILLYSIAASFLISRPITSLLNAIRRVGETSDLDIRIEVKSKDEIAQLSMEFNRMLQRLSHLADERATAQKRESQLIKQTLQMKTNPHFTFNVLDNIRWTALEGKGKEVDQYLGYFSSLLRRNMSTDIVVSLENELEAAKDYIALEKMRFGDKLDYYEEVPRKLKNKLVLSFIIQPLLENAIVHGYMNHNQILSIFLNVRQEEDRLVIEVDDNGVGADAVQVRKLILGEDPESHTSILNNIQTRIKLYFGGNEMYGIWFDSQTETGTSVKIVLPIGEEPYSELW